MCSSLILGRPKEAEAWFPRANALARETGDLNIVAAFHADTAATLYAMLANAGAMLIHAREAVQVAERLEAPAVIANTYRSLGNALLASGAVNDALGAYEKALSTNGGFEWRPFIICGLAYTYFVLGDGEKALNMARDAANATLRTQSPLVVFVTQGCVAEVLLFVRGAKDEIETALQAAESAVATIGARAFEPWVLTLRARLLTRLRKEAEALSAAETAVTTAVRLGTRRLEIDARVTLAEILLHSQGASATKRIDEELRRAMAMVDEGGWKISEPFIRMLLAEVAALSGDQGARDHQLREAYRLFTKMGAQLRGRRRREGTRLSDRLVRCVKNLSAAV